MIERRAPCRPWIRPPSGRRNAGVLRGERAFAACVRSGPIDEHVQYSPEQSSSWPALISRHVQNQGERAGPSRPAAASAGRKVHSSIADAIEPGDQQAPPAATRRRHPAGRSECGGSSPCHFLLAGNEGSTSCSVPCRRWSSRSTATVAPLTPSSSNVVAGQESLQRSRPSRSR